MKKSNIMIITLIMTIITFFTVFASSMEPEKDLSNFIEGYHTTKGKVLKALEGGALDNLQNPLNLSIIYSPDTALIGLKLYDLLGSFEGGSGSRVEGTLFLTPYKGYKEIVGNNIVVSYDHVYEESKMYMYEKGDRHSEKGILYTDRNELEYHFTKERGGEKLQRTVTELVKLSNGDYLLQYFFCAAGKELKAVFMRFNESEMSFIVARGEKNIEFEYSSILGNDLPVTEMAEGYLPELVVDINGAKVEYQENF